MARNRDRSHLAKAYAEILADEAAAQSTQAASQDVTDLSKERQKRLLGVHIHSDEYGQRHMVVRFQTGKTEPQEVDCSTWLERGLLGEQLTRAWHAQNGVKTSSSTISNERKILNHFFRHLAEYVDSGHTLNSVADFTSEVLHSFPNYLDKVTTAKGDLLREDVKQRYYGLVRQLLEFMKVTEPFKTLMPPVLPLKKVAYSGARTRAVSSVEALPDDQAAQIDAACIREMEEYMRRFKQGEEWCQQYKGCLPDKHSAKWRDFTSLGMMIAALYHQVGFPMPSYKQLKKDYPALVAAISHFCYAYPSLGQEHGLYCDGGYGTLLTYLCPTPRSIIPFVVMMGRHTYFNPSTLLGLDRKWISENILYGDEQTDIRVSIAAEKGRAAQPQVRSFPKGLKRIDNPTVILDNIHLYATHLREQIDPELRDRVWQFIELRGDGILKADTYKPGKGRDDFTADGQWFVPFKAFKQENNLPDFSLRQLRATGSEAVDRATGGDIKAQQVALQHSAAGVVERHYTSGPAKQRRREKLAAFMLERERWIASEGKSDARDGKRCGNAVTPGFHCADIFASPMPGQKEGRTCSAYLSCPVCPLAAVDSNDPKALAYLVRIDDAIEDAKDRANPERWRNELAPVLLKIRHTWLHVFTEEAIWDQAAELIDQLPDIFVE